jgi:hypothetical protein
LIAFAISIAVHEVVAGLVPAYSSRAPASREIVTRVSVARVVVRHLPTPKPMQLQPRLRPRPTSHPIDLRLVQSEEGRSGRHSLTRKFVSAPLIAARIASAVPVWHVATTGAKTAGMLAAGGRGGSTGTGPGQGTHGSGAGAASGDEPCGFVEFSDPHGSQFDRQTRGFWVDIRMAVHFADGTSQSMLLDYAWYYPNEAANPWSDLNLKDPNFPTRFQPPPTAKLSGEPELVRYVIAHSTPDGMTLLKECPVASPTPAV